MAFKPGPTDTLSSAIRLRSLAQVRPTGSRGVAIRREIHSFSADLSDADQLAKLDAAHPGTIERVLDYADREQSHRHQMHNAWNDQEREQLAEATRLFARAQAMMFVLAGGAIVGGIVLALIDAPASGLALIVIALTSLALAFIWGKTHGR
jgi:uncharacterized membrane protein